MDTRGHLQAVILADHLHDTDQVIHLTIQVIHLILQAEAVVAEVAVSLLLPERFIC